MDGPELGRLRKLIVISWLMMLGLLIGCALWGSYSIREIKYDLSYLQSHPTQPQIKLPQVRDGVDGMAGEKGETGHPGRDGVNGSNGNNGEHAPQGPKGEKGDTGEQGPAGEVGPQGDKGEPGKTVSVRYNPITSQEECRYGGDIEWQPISECQ